MTSSTILLLALPFAALITQTGCGSPQRPAATADGREKAVHAVGVTAPGTFRWATPEQWKSETIPFPLDFAPSLPYRGVEELRFAPHFFDPKAETYFSYSFAWLLDGAPDAQSFSAEHLAQDLAVYFKGLAHAVDAARFDPHAHDARLEIANDGHYRGRVTTVDAFGDGHALALNVDGEIFTCGPRRVVLFSLSPQPEGGGAWASLLEQRRTFQCTAR
jgi:hypothetical protein